MRSSAEDWEEGGRGSEEEKGEELDGEEWGRRSSEEEDWEKGGREAVSRKERKKGER